MIAAPPHKIGCLALDVEAPDPEIGFAIRERIEAAARDTIPGALERAFDALGLGERHLWIDRIDLDLGLIRPDTLEADLIAALERTLPASLQTALASASTTPPPPDPARPIYIANAGLVLATPFLRTLFERLGWGHDNDAEDASRIVHLLQYLVTGRLDTPEPELALNKLLAGLPLSTPIAPAITASPEDLETCDGLLAAMIANWPVIKNSSVAALRESFLQRDGKLQHGDERWSLIVQRKALDVLLDQIPWNFSIVFQRPMPEAIHVSW